MHYFQLLVNFLGSFAFAPLDESSCSSTAKRRDYESFPVFRQPHRKLVFEALLPLAGDKFPRQIRIRGAML
jgi:hypothetical protein